VHLDWTKLTGEVDTYKSAEQLKKVLAKKGITSDTKVVAYCHQGIGRATDLILAMKLIGYDNVLEYTGSWQEWSRDPRLPVER
jgi:thiosulfate/3-mercaptopyruvate sulfurtransferase